MLQAKSMCVVALLGLLTGTAANADDRYSGPQIRLGVDMIWGGYGYAPPQPPVVWYPAYSRPYPAYYESYPAYYQGRGHSRNHRHKKHRHHGRHHDD
jgi:hypothetical protein